MPPGPRPGRSGATRSSISRSTVSNEAAGCCAERLDSPEELLGDPFDVGGLDLPLVRLHDVADQATDLLGVGDPERGEALADERAQLRLVEPLGKVALAEGDLEAELRHLGGAALARLLELGERLLELLPIGADDVADEGVVHLAREALRRAALLEPGLEHAHHVGGPGVPCLDRLVEPLVELSLESHRRHSGTRSAVSSRTFLRVSRACAAPSTGEASPRNLATSSSLGTGFSASPRATVVSSSTIRPSRSAILTWAVG